ncbi:MAG: hypothetical protein MUF71_20940 [Candidatus Kapabacteria bacterium]|jgi:hypothetical protein|nr:hypothetical protein [Candidatus Kapabacteria bacterium]
MTIITEHEYFDFMRSLTNSMADEYQRLQRYAKTDTGTAGDQSEEYWADFLRNWLPATYEVVTKGRILPYQGSPTNQVDILILRPDYPRHLRNQKMYFAGGVVAAFECKTTLRLSDLSKIVKNAIMVKNAVPVRLGSLYKELHQPIIFGVLAHSIEKKGSDIIFKLHKHLHSKITKEVKHPRELIDVICIADTATFILEKATHIGEYADAESRQEFQEFDSLGGIMTTYFEHTDNLQDLHISGQVLGTLVFKLTQLLAYENSMLREFARYLELSGKYVSIGTPILWNKNVLTENVINHLLKLGYSDQDWSEWQENY